MSTNVTPLFQHAQNYLIERAIPENKIDLLNLQIVAGARLNEFKINDKGCDSAIVWVPCDLDGEPNGTVGARLIHNHERGGAATFGAALGIKSKASPKFMVPHKQRGRLYHPPHCDWGGEGKTVYLCESWLKADVVALAGYKAIGVQGIWGWSWQETKENLNRELKSDFAKLLNRGYKIVAFFDSNVNPDNEKNYLALQQLNSSVNAVRPGHDDSVKWIGLPAPSDDEDWGCDDYAAKWGMDGLRDVLNSEPLVLTDSTSLELAIFDREVVLVKEISKIIERATGHMFNRNDAIKSQWADRKHSYVNDKGDVKHANTCEAWFEWPNRTYVGIMDYRPGEEQLVLPEHDEYQGLGYWNEWTPSDVVPEEGDVGLFLKWLEDAVPDEDSRRWLVNWMAWQFQNPSGRIPTACMLLGKAGTGKGWLAEILRRAFGAHNSVNIALGDMGKTETAQFTHKQFVLIDEADSLWRDDDKIYRALKSWITATIHKKRALYANTKMVHATGAIMIQGNDLDILKLDDDDRRFGVIFVQGAGFAKQAEYWDKRWEWLDNGGVGAILHWLLSLDLEDFKPNGEPPRTEAKDMMAMLTRSDEEQWLEGLASSPEEYLVSPTGEFLGFSAYTSRELYQIYLGDFSVYIEDYKTEKDLSNAIRRFSRLIGKAGFKMTDAKRIKVVPRAKKATVYPESPAPTAYFVINPGSIGPAVGATWADDIRARPINKMLNTGNLY